MGLRSLDPLLTEYAADEHSIAQEFYCPCLAASTKYLRITGFFSSLAFLIAWPALRGFVRNQGRMRIICSPRISERDRAGYVRGYDSKSDGELARRLNSELQSLMSSDEMRNPTGLLACLVSEGFLEIRFATLATEASLSTQRMFHDKVGVFLDSNNDAVGFRGSMNETFLGLSPTMGHVDSIDVFPSWSGGRDRIRVARAIERFDRLWRGDSARLGVSITDIPPDVGTALDKIAAEVDLESALATINEEGVSRRRVRTVDLWAHQADALRKWESSGRRGILAHATGSGKTVTGVTGIRRIHEEGGGALVVVPGQEIQRQWDEELRRFTAPVPLLCGGGHSEWRDSRLLRSIAREGGAFSVVAVLGTAKQPSFLAQLKPALDRLLFVGDEVHRLGAPDARDFLSRCDAPMRLGLSATPKRANDPEGTRIVMEYFGGVIDSYQLADALVDGRLTRYRYSVREVPLTSTEQAEWREYSSRIGVLAARIRDEENSDLDRQMQRLLQERARIRKGASLKVDLSASILAEVYQPGQRWLIYCDNRSQMRAVAGAIQELDIPVQEFHSAMTGDRSATLQWFAERGGVIVAIRCLDEGVNIPNADNGLILASSTNRREFIQRRGRLLRRNRGKSLASIIDIIVVPADDHDSSLALQLLGPELARALIFSKHSESPSTVTALEHSCIRYGIDLEVLDDLASQGVEEDL